MDEATRMAFEQAMGECFAAAISPPVPFEDASAHECCEAIWSVLGHDVTPARLTALSDDEVAGLTEGIGAYFETDPPSQAQIRLAIARTLRRWPAG